METQLQQPTTQLEVIQFMIAQLNEQFLPNAISFLTLRVEEIQS